MFAFLLVIFIKISFPCCFFLPRKRNVDKQLEMIHICSCAISYTFDKVASYKRKRRNKKKLKCVVNQNFWPGCVFFIYLVTSKAANLALSCAFGFVSVMGFNALDCLGIELFPTHVRYYTRHIPIITF